MAMNRRADPYRAFKFLLEVDGVVRGGFSEVTGLTAEGTAVDHREGAALQPDGRKLSALMKYSNITLQHGYTADQSLWKWLQSISDGKPHGRKLTVVLMDERREPVRRWRVENARINKIEGPALNAAGNDLAIESVELVHEGLKLER